MAVEYRNRNTSPENSSQINENRNLVDNDRNQDDDDRNQDDDVWNQVDDDRNQVEEDPNQVDFKQMGSVIGTTIGSLKWPLVAILGPVAQIGSSFFAYLDRESKRQNEYRLAELESNHQ